MVNIYKKRQNKIKKGEGNLKKPVDISKPKL